MFIRTTCTMATAISLAACPSMAHAQWMGDLLNDPLYGEQFENTRLSELVLPGTHDSATYEILGTAIPVAGVDIAGGLGDLLALVPGTPLEDLASAQSTTVGQQLTDGVRALDVRLYRDAADGEVYGLHTWKAAPAQDVLDDLADFLTTPGNENELVFVQLSHKDNTQGVADFLVDFYTHPAGLGTLGDFMIPKVVGDPDHQAEWANPLVIASPVGTLSDPTLEQALANGQLIVSFNQATVDELVTGNHFSPGYETTIPPVLWQSPFRRADLFTINGGVYPNWEDVESEPKLLGQMLFAAANGFDMGTSYWSPLGLNSGVNTADLLDTSDFDVPRSLLQYAANMNWNSISQLAGLPRKDVNIVELDHYRPEYTEEFIKLNKGVYELRVSPNGGAVTTTFDSGGIFEGDPDYFPRFIVGNTAAVWDSTYWTSSDYVENHYTGDMAPYALATERSSKDEGGGPLTEVSGTVVTEPMTGLLWSFTRSFEIHSSDPEPLVVALYENDTDYFPFLPISYGYDPVALTPDKWAAELNDGTDARFLADLALPDTSSNSPLGSLGNVAMATVTTGMWGEAYAADLDFQIDLCEWGINCFFDPAITVEANGAYEVASGGDVDLSSRGSEYPSSRLRLKWDMADGGPLVPDSTASGEPARFSAAGLVGNQQIEIRLLAVRSVIDASLGAPDDPLAEDTARVFVCTDWDGDGLFDGAAGPNQDPEVLDWADPVGPWPVERCPNVDDDDDEDGVADLDDSAPTDPTVCRDLDLDGCDDCSVGVDGVGPLPDNDVYNDGPDADGDGTCDLSDLCFGDNATGDSDSDGVCDSDDLCAGDDASGDSDSDGACDDLDVCPLDNPDDTDADGVCDSDDVCPGFDDGDDADGDTVSDGCDVCRGDDASGDSDGDGVCDDLDVCPLDNPDDTDADGVCDSDDACPGFDDTVDSDGDTVADGCDACPADNPDDADGDGVCDSDVQDGPTDGGDPPDKDASGGCGCDTATPAGPLALWLPLAALVVAHRRRSKRLL